MKRLENVYSTLFFIGLLLIPINTYASISVIVHPDNKDSVLEAKQIKKMFMGKVKQTSSGQKVIAVNQPESSSVTAEFNKKVLKKTNARLKAYWTKMIMSGKGAKPEEEADNAAIKLWVASHINAIGYIDSGAVDETVKVVFSID